jgi:hypothetical protein
VQHHRQAHPEHVAREVLLGDADLALLPALTDLVEIGQHHLGQPVLDVELLEDLAEDAVRAGLVEGLESGLQPVDPLRR